MHACVCLGRTFPQIEFSSFIKVQPSEEPPLPREQTKLGDCSVSGQCDSGDHSLLDIDKVFAVTLVSRRKPQTTSPL